MVQTPEVMLMFQDSPPGSPAQPEQTRAHVVTELHQPAVRAHTHWLHLEITSFLIYY